MVQSIGEKNRSKGRRGEDLPDYCTCDTLVLGCGNILFGDDGFGPAVIEHLASRYTIPEVVSLIDAGTGARRLLATIGLGEIRPGRIILVDCVDRGMPPGNIEELTPDGKAQEAAAFSVHQALSPECIRELQALGVDVRLLVCQAGRMPDQVSPGLSPEVAGAVPAMARMIAELLGAAPR
jgi:coenzyme F420 hydrogenase subunit delta